MATLTCWCHRNQTSLPATSSDGSRQIGEGFLHSPANLSATQGFYTILPWQELKDLLLRDVDTDRASKLSVATPYRQQGAGIVPCSLSPSNIV
ncbi:hypothetical protein R1flu_000285 [Riccia fluitans]|uniref:Uncharacterized protein n=1 Tax=Riccia fluitans TaxID=41844 RepID=A0ABD1Y020_9MARC